MANVIEILKPGDHRVLQQKKHVTRPLASGEVKIKVHYSGINFADLLMRQGLYPDAPSYPFVPGYEVSGEITEIASDIADFQVGQRVMAGTFFGGYADEVVLKAWQVKKVPADWSLEEGCAFVVSYLTASATLEGIARVQKGERIFVDCASGALGQMMAKCLRAKFGAEIFLAGATSSEEKKSFILNSGFDLALTHQQAIEYAQKSENRFDLVINSRGAQSLSIDFQKVSSLGRMVALGASDFLISSKRKLVHSLVSFFKMPRFSSISLMNNNKMVGGVNMLRLLEDRGQIEKLWQEMPDLTPAHVDRIFPASQAGQAHRYLEQRKSKGKVLLHWP